MGILGLGVSFRRAPVELLERLAFTDDDLTKAYRFALDQPGIEEAVILSTCNRVEVYGAVATYHAGFLGLKRVLSETRDIAADELSDPLYSHWERDAADHLFEVAAGLDSMVLGETQIHAQVREALRRASAEGAAGAGSPGCSTRRLGPGGASARRPRSARRPMRSSRSAPTSPPRRSATSAGATSWSSAPARWPRSP